MVQSNSVGGTRRLPATDRAERGNAEEKEENMSKTYQTYQLPTPPTLTVTGAAARSVAAADEAGRAAHQVLADIHAVMVAHDTVDIAGIDATWCAQALRLLARRRVACDAIRYGTLVPRWREFGMHQLVTWHDADAVAALAGRYCGNVESDWEAVIKTYAATLAAAGVPPVIECLTAEAWDDAAARGC